jgi:gamma-glutamylcysteine synthetase
VSTLTRREAVALDKRVRAASDKFTNAAATLLGLLDDTERQQIHAALGTSWTTWLEDAVRVDISDRGERTKLVKLLNGRTYRLTGEAGDPP